ncbi:MAG: hypothetical protein PVF74_00495 [Anaerolineales bacterium]
MASMLVGIFVIALLLGCYPTSPSLTEIGAGTSKVKVLATFGEPDQVQDFVLPDHPFFGPQEGLANLVPPGTVIEEWVYEIGDEVTYVWYTGQADEPREDWRVLATARHPIGAVF